MSNALSDDVLLGAARAGDTDALDKLVRRHLPDVRRYSWKLCGQSEDADDVSQETLIAAAGNIERFRGESSFGSWLYTIARNFCIKRRRRGKFEPASTQQVDELSPRDLSQLSQYVRTPEDDVSDNETATALRQAISQLDPIYRDVLVMRDVEGLSAPEVAIILGINLHTVKTRLHRARLSLRERISPLLGL